MQRKPYSIQHHANVSPKAKFSKFSDFKNNTISTAEKQKTQSDVGQKNISQFLMSSNTKIHVKLKSRKNLMTFGGVKAMKQAQDRVLSCLSNLQQLKKTVKEELDQRKYKVYKIKLGKSKKGLTFEKIKILKEFIEKDDYIEALKGTLREVDRIEEESRICAQNLEGDIKLKIEELEACESKVLNLIKLVSKKVLLIMQNEKLFSLPS